MRVPAANRKVLYDALGLSFFEPQAELVYNVTDPFLMFAGGIGAGKSMTAARYLLPELLVPGRIFWIVAADFVNGRSEFDWTLRYTEMMGLEVEGEIARPKDGEWSVKWTNGTSLTTKSGRHPDGMHSLPVDGIIVAEAGQVSQWLIEERCIPRITRTDINNNPTGDPGWMLLCGTFEGSNVFLSQRYYEVLSGREGWSAYTMATWENTISYPGGRLDPKITLAEKELSTESFMQRYGAVPMTPAGLVYKEFSKVHHVDPMAEFDLNLPVQLFVDPGSYYAVGAIQFPSGAKRSGHVNLIDEVYLHGGTTEMAIMRAVERPWFNNVLPTQAGWIDVEAPEMRTTWASGAIWEQVRERSERQVSGFILQGRKIAIETNIERVKTFLHSKVYNRIEQQDEAWEYAGQMGVARLHINPRCQNTIREFTSWQNVQVGRSDTGKPRDEFNHMLKALGYGLIGNFGTFSPYAGAAISQAEREVIAMTRD